MIRVVVAEDSLTVRELLVEILESDPEIRVVGQAKNGAEAVELAARLKPDLITMDVHMPVMDGFEATKEIMVQAPRPIILVSSSASPEDVGLSFNALRAGALMVVAKPDNPQSALFDGRREQFLTMAKAMSQVKVAVSGEPLRERSVLLAPDDRHLGVSRDARVVVADAPPISGFRPSGTYLFDSVAQTYGASVAAVILTGMGSDGVAGLRTIKAAGGHVLAQDEATCVVYGMPREAVAAGVVDAVLPIDAVAVRLVELAQGPGRVLGRA